MNATMTYEQRTGNSSPFLFLIILAIVISAGAIVVGKYSHGDAKHGADAVAVRQCLNDRGTRMQFQSGVNPNRYIFICNFGDGRYGFRVAEVINDKLEEITAYIKEQKLDVISRDLKGAGARCMKGCLP